MHAFFRIVSNNLEFGAQKGQTPVSVPYSQEEIMDGQYKGMAIGVFELDSECACFVALDAAAKTADVKIQAVERNRLSAGACVKMRGNVSDVKAAMEAALEAARPMANIVSHTVIAAPAEDTEIAIEMTIHK